MAIVTVTMMMVVVVVMVTFILDKNGFFIPLKLNLFLDLFLDSEVDYRVPHENELQSTYHDWRTS